MQVEQQQFVRNVRLVDTTIKLDNLLKLHARIVKQTPTVFQVPQSVLMMHQIVQSEHTQVERQQFVMFAVPASTAM